MEFLTFNEWEKLNTTEVVEFQFCKIKQGAPLKKILSIKSIKFFENDSLFLKFSSIQNFLDRVGDVFSCGIYNNLKTGPIDIFGINYFKKEDIPSIIEKIKQRQVGEFQRLIGWLEKAQNYNGFYVLGI